jgi:ATP-binding cassette subfamily B protein
LSERAETRSESSSQTLFQLLRFLRPYHGRLLAASLALVFTAGATLMLGQGVRLLIDGGLAAQSPSALKEAAFFVLAVALAMAVGTYLRFYLVSWLGERVSADLRREVFNNLVRLHPSYFDENRGSEIMSRLTTDTTLLQTLIGSSVSMALRSMLTVTGSIVMMVLVNPRLAVAILVAAPLTLLPIVAFGRSVRRLSSSSQDSLANVGSYAGEVIHHIRTVQSHTQEAFEQDAFGREVETAFSIAKRRIRQRSLLVATAILLLFSGLTGLLWLGGQDVINGRMSGGDLGAFLFYAIMVGGGLATLSEVWGDLQRAAGATERLLELLAVSSAIPPTPSPRTLPSGSLELQIDSVAFHYATRSSEPALRGVTLTVPAGQSLALVGPSGAGKTTLFELLLRFYDPEQGAIRLGGIDLRDLSLQTLREHISLVPQQPALFTGTVAYNIAYGRPDASPEQIADAARRAHAVEFIERLPQGYQTFLGDKGVQLSGGQRQRIALARAILNDPPLLLLDEATSALDAESEFRVQQGLQALMQGRTTLIIAHRLATVQHVDKIAVMEKGQVMATGTHQELMQSSPLYARLAELQFGGPDALTRAGVWDRGVS